MKKITITLFLCLIILLVNVMAANLQPGDINGDGKVGTADYILVRKHLLGTSLTGQELKRADVNSDGKISVQDYINIRKTIINGTPIVNPTTKPTATAVATKYNLEAYFLNTYNQSSFKETYSGNDAFIFKTSNGKYILLDTGINSSDIKKAIYNQLKSLQGKSNVVVDYMIISHMHNDHYGNAADIMNDTKFTIKKLILKKEQFSSIDESLIKTANSRNIPIVDTNSKFSEGSYYTLSDNIKIYFFNVKDIYTASDKCERREVVTSFTSNINNIQFVKSSSNKYIYMEGVDYLNDGNSVKIKTRSDIVESLGSDYRIKGRFYLGLFKDGAKRSPCSSNANSIAILFQVKTDKGNKYMYIPSDIENNGYDSLGEYDSSLKATIHGYGPTYFYEYKEENGQLKYVIKNNKLVQSTKTTPVRKASSYKTALKMKDTFSDLAGNITVYQSAHHGLNNYPEVVNALKLNSSSVYTITPTASNPKTNKTFATSSGAYYLRNTNIMYDGGASKQGTKCTITSKGTTSCAYY